MTSTRQKVLFVCIHNSARSQMAEAWLNHFCSDNFEAHSAGLEPGTLNPVVVEVMAEAGIDISSNTTKSVDAFLDADPPFDYIVTVCDETSAERCPVFPCGGTRLHWGFPDPSQVTGSQEEKLARIRPIRDAIRARILEFCEKHCPTPTPFS